MSKNGGVSAAGHTGISYYSDKDPGGCASRAEELASLDPGSAEASPVDVSDEAETRELVRATVGIPKRPDAGSVPHAVCVQKPGHMDRP